MGDVGVYTMFEKDTWRMVWGEMVLMRGVQIETLYKLLGSTIINGCNRTSISEDKAERFSSLLVKKTML